MKMDAFQSSINYNVCARITVTVCVLIMLPYCAHTYKRYCHVIENKANCSGHGRGLTYIPKLGNRINEIEFNNNYLPNVNNDTFLNVSVKHITVLSLESNQIHNISANAFKSFMHLGKLYLSGNYISVTQLRKLLFSLADMSNLTYLFLSNLSLPSVPQDLFSQMNGNRLHAIYLRSNNITNISREMFENFKELEVLDLKHNNVRVVQLPVLNCLKSLHFKNNKLEHIPDFCTCDSNYKSDEEESVAPSLTHLLTSKNYIRYITNTSFQCIRNLTYLDISGNHIQMLPNDMLTTVPNIRILIINNMNVYTLQIEPHAFQSLSLQKLYLNNNNKKTANTLLVAPNETFAHVPNLTHLNFGGIKLLHETDECILQMFNSLTKLTYLSLRGCEISSIPKGLFENKHQLQTINLNNNYLTTFNDVPFKNISALRALTLRNNYIRTIEQNILKKQTFSKLKLLDLSKNPFDCQCDLQWFIEWLKTRKKYPDMRNYPEQYACASPSSMHEQLLANTSFTYRECHPWSVAFWVGVIAGPTLCLLVVIVTLIYRNRWNIKHYMFLMRKRRNYKQIQGHDFLFDAFVGYNQDDYEWVIGQLLPILETQEGYKLCIHDRNFKPGRYIHDNITQCMEDSRKIILVLTNEFAKSGWCTYELKLAHTKHIEDETDVIIVMLEKPEARYMNKSLKSLLGTTTYIEWTDDEIGRQLFWAKLKDSMKT